MDDPRWGVQGKEGRGEGEQSSLANPMERYRSKRDSTQNGRPDRDGWTGMYSQ